MDEEQEAKRRAFGELASDTRILMHRLNKMEVGETVSYEELTQLIARNVQGEGRGNLDTARRHAGEQQGCIYDAVRGVGIKRLPATEAPGVADRHIHGMRRKARRVTRSLLSVAEKGQADNETLVKINARIGQFGGIQVFTRSNASARIESKIDSQSPQQLPLERTLELFTKNNGQQ